MPEPSPEPSHIIAISASAGGLEPLERLFDTIDDRTGLAFVVIQHLSPDYKSLMPEKQRRGIRRYRSSG
ncbi:MAG: chemotaxis protein CheB [Planctomycetota bacterium]